MELHDLKKIFGETPIGPRNTGNVSNLFVGLLLTALAIGGIILYIDYRNRKDSEEKLKKENT